MPLYTNLPLWQLEDDIIDGQPYDLGSYINGVRVSIQLSAIVQQIGQGCLLEPVVNPVIGSITEINVLQPGEGYSTTTANIVITNTAGNPGIMASAYPLIDASGRIYRVLITNNGIGYTDTAVNPTYATVVDNNSITYSLVAGTFPNSLVIDPFRLTSSGLLTGTPAPVIEDSVSTFVIRATDTLGNYRDQTFTLTVYAFNAPTLTVIPGSFIAVISDSTWVNTQIPYSNPNPMLPVTFNISSGALPQGMWLTSDGVLNGYPAIPGYTYEATEYLIAISGQNTNRLLLEGDATDSFFPGNFISTTGNNSGVYRINVTDPLNFDPDTLQPRPGVWYNAASDETTVVLSGNQITNITTGSPTYTVNPYRDYSFFVTVSNLIGSDTKEFFIRVTNQAITPNITPLRLPVLVNNQPRTQYVQPQDPYASFYLNDTNSLGDYSQGGFLAFKFIGYDFNNYSVSYQITGLEQFNRLTFDMNTGWLTGITPNLGNETRIFKIQVRAVSADQLGVPILGQWYTFTFKVIGDVSNQIDWVSPAQLGTLDNGSISMLSVLATNPSNLRLKYLLTGTYPVQLSGSSYLNRTQSLLINGVEYDDLSESQTLLLVSGAIPNGVTVGMQIRSGVSGTDPFLNPQDPYYPQVVDIIPGLGIVIDKRIPSFSGTAIVFVNALAISGYRGNILVRYGYGDFFPANTNDENDITAVAANNTGLVAVDSGGRILNSADGRLWIFNNNLLPSAATKVKYFTTTTTDYQGFYLVGDPYPFQNSFSGLLRFSADGQTWQQIDNGALIGYTFNDIVATETKVVMIGNRFFDIQGNSKGLIYQSDQARPQLSFSLVNIDTQSDLIAIAVGISGATTVYITVGTQGAIYTSTDAETWTQRVIPNFVEDLSGVVFDGTRFVIVGNNGTIITATLATTPIFSVSSADNPYNFTGIAYHPEIILPGTTAIGYVITTDIGVALIGNDLSNLSNPLAPPLPPNLSLLPTGEIAGRAAFQTTNIQPTSVPYTFTVQAVSVEYPEIAASREFTINIFQRWEIPYETLYFKGFLPLDDRAKISELIDNTGIVSLEISNPGRGYADPPTVTIDPPGLATAYCSINTDSEIRSITITDPGYNYNFALPPQITIDPPVQGSTLWQRNTPVELNSFLYYLDPATSRTNFYKVITFIGEDPRTGIVPPTFTFGSQVNGTLELMFSGTLAEAAASVDQLTGSITNVVINVSGYGYLAVPNITFQAPPNVQTATAVATIVLGRVTALIVTNSGSGYRSEPKVTISASPLGDSETATATSVMYMPDNILYRPEDEYFGKATSVIYQHQYGVNASSYQEYIDSVDKNFYKRRLLLGEIKTATAKDNLGNVVYEVVYSQIQDNLTVNGFSVNKEIRYPVIIRLSDSFYYVSSSTLFSSYGVIPRYEQGYPINISGATFQVSSAAPLELIQVGDYLSPVNFDLSLSGDTRVLTYNSSTGTGTLSTAVTADTSIVAYFGEKVYFTSLSPRFVDRLYPASLDNMRRQISDTIGVNPASTLLPRWMTSQQENGRELGFVPAWVICYTKPGFSSEVKRSIETYYPHTLNSIDFQIDRFEVDKSATYNYYAVDPDLEPQWQSFPSGSPVPSPGDSRDWFVFFPQKTILPRI